MTLCALYLTFGYLYAVLGSHETTMRYRENYPPDQTCLAIILLCVVAVALTWPVFLWSNRGWTWVEIPDYGQGEGGER
ncbi:MAG: hypothetical protein WA210_09075 [Burkholderiaceae bacterium]